MAPFRIEFLPDRREAVVEKGQTLLEAAQQANVYAGAVCGGDGTCGKCRLIVREGEVDGDSTDFLTREEIRRGYVLACQVVPKSDLVVEVPPESRLTGYHRIAEDSQRFRDFAPRAPERAATELDPVVRKSFLTILEPTLEDPTADQERVLAAVARQWPGPIQMGLKITRELPRVLRHCQTKGTHWTWKWDGHVTATVACRGDVNEVLSVERGDTTGRHFGLAIDVGTTTVVAHLVDLSSGETVEAAAKYNSQIGFGEDIVNRINYARRPGGAEALHRAVIQDIETLIEELVQTTNVHRGDIVCAVAAGNTTMTHFLLGLESDLIRLAPFIPAAANPPPIRAAEVGLRIHPRGILYTLPIVGSYVGGDITAGILVSRIHEAEELSLLLDIGTNGEVVLGNRDFLIACSASAGPAFEGASVTYGMRATSGAIDRVRISHGGQKISLTTIDDEPPVGLCGTGLIDCLAGMFLSGVIDRSGRIQPDVAGPRYRVSPEDGLAEYVLVGSTETLHWRDLVIRQTDVENLIRTKASIYAAADSLVQSIGLSFDDIQRVYIAGAFGNKLDLASCIAIGLLPDVPIERIRFIGNSSVAGAKRVMTNRKLFDQLPALCQRITYQELMADPSYMERFTSACFLPHTDSTRFPSVDARLEQYRAVPVEASGNDNVSGNDIGNGNSNGNGRRHSEQVKERAE